jgi:hypothetical protein
VCVCLSLSLSVFVVFLDNIFLFRLNATPFIKSLSEPKRKDRERERERE